MDERSLRDRATPGETDRVTLLPSNLVARLRAAHESSVQRAWGSNIFGDAADEIERLRAENEALRHDLERSMANHVADISAHETEEKSNG